MMIRSYIILIISTWRCICDVVSVAVADAEYTYVNKQYDYEFKTIQDFSAISDHLTSIMPSGQPSEQPSYQPSGLSTENYYYYTAEPTNTPMQNLMNYYTYYANPSKTSAPSPNIHSPSQPTPHTTPHFHPHIHVHMPSGFPTGESMTYYTYYAYPSKTSAPSPSIHSPSQPTPHPTPHFHPHMHVHMPSGFPTGESMVYYMHYANLSKTSAPSPSILSPSQPTPHPTPHFHPHIHTPHVTDAPSVTPLRGGEPSLDETLTPSGRTAAPTPIGTLGKDWWYFTLFHCTLWGEPPPSAAHRIHHILSACRHAVDFVLRDRLGMHIVLPPEASTSSTSAPLPDSDGLWVETAMSTRFTGRIAEGPSPIGDDDTAAMAVGTILSVGVWTAIPDSLDSITSVLAEVNRQPEILVGPLHIRDLRSVTSVSIALTNSTTTRLPPPTPVEVNAYQEVSRIGWVIGGTVGVFTVSIGVIVMLRTCFGKNGIIRQIFAMHERPQWSLGSMIGYKPFRNVPPLRDLDSFRLDDDEVTIELQDM